ncbi:hypothetical protein D3C74_329390 [compost metagenome]
MCFVGDFYIRKRLIIFKQYVIPRMMLFDEITFENKCLSIAACNDILKISNFGDQPLRLPIMAAGKIGSDSVLKNFSLPYVNNGSFFIFHQIAARLIRQKRQLVANTFKRLFLFR